jgi:peptidoglycan-associated lipoprotein
MPVRFFALAAALLLISLGCAAKLKDGECKASDDCAAQAGFGRVCVEGRCQECSASADCKSGFECRANKCQVRAECEKDADCSGGRSCQAGRCTQAAKAETAPAPAAPSEAKGGCEKLTMVHFGFNDASLTPADEATLQRDFQCLKSKNTRHVLIAGHADERGTAEYNVALANKRAATVKRYLSQLGLPAGTIETISYGAEKPLDPAHNEDAWSENRRAELSAGKGKAK